MSANTLSVDHAAISVNGPEASRSAISAIDGAIILVNSQRSMLAATSNRLSYAVNNLTNVSNNLTAALAAFRMLIMQRK